MNVSHSSDHIYIISDPCRYVKGAWSDCDPKTNMRSRILTLKKGDQNTCEQTKTIQKKCKKGNIPVLYICSLLSECLSLSMFIRLSKTCSHIFQIFC